MDGIGGDRWMALEVMDGCMGQSHSAILKCTHRKECSVGPPSLSDARAGHGRAKYLIIVSVMYEVASVMHEQIDGVGQQHSSEASIHTHLSAVS